MTQELLISPPSAVIFWSNTHKNSQSNPTGSFCIAKAAQDANILFKFIDKFIKHLQPQNSPAGKLGNPAR